ncbi:MAG: Signal transduction histidine kinase regulating C4-dicarboxylate transport system (EC [uncultured Paraburkholderia sp.]|nr:MAG: Signal transduction histidine kinase regulating C4-dicarboxylate transport system (EC [uncultured Paraburkholderia sp.]
MQKEVAERTRAEQELRAAHDELIQASKLAALRGFSDNTRVLLERGDQASARENLEAIAALTERMGKITISSSCSSDGRGRAARVRRLCALGNAVALLQKRLQGVELELALFDAESGARTRLDLADDHPDLIAHCDDLRLEQVLINLLGNALDATAGIGAPRISVHIEIAADNLSFAVSDNGPGIPEDVLPRLFEPFFTTKEMGQGLGLGLAISSSIARDCGGTLVARNAPQGGALFVLTLRRARAQTSPAADPLATGS